MSLFKKFNENLNSKKSIRFKWDSRKSIELKKLNSMHHEEVQKFIEGEDKYLKYSKCFISNEYLTQVTQYISDNKTYNKCEFEIGLNFEIGNFIKRNTFNDCIFYLNNSNEIINILEIFHNDALIKLKANNLIIYDSYIEHLAKKHNYNLNNVSNKLLYGISINNTDLSKYILPSNPLFFKSLATNTISNVSFGDVDFRKYDMSNLFFNNIKFSKNTFLSEEMLCNAFRHCILPAIDFTIYNKSAYSRFRFSRCTFNKNTIFPKNENFFLDCAITACQLPSYNYSKYLINHITFKDCTFTDDSTLPDAIFTTEYIYKVNHIYNIPKKHLADCVKFAYIYNPTLFLEKYIDSLTLPIYALLCKKYNITEKRANNNI